MISLFGVNNNQPSWHFGLASLLLQFFSVAPLVFERSAAELEILPRKAIEARPTMRTRRAGAIEPVRLLWMSVNGRG